MEKLVLTLKQMTLTSERHTEHLFAGQNTQQQITEGTNNLYDSIKKSPFLSKCSLLLVTQLHCHKCVDRMIVCVPLHHLFKHVVSVSQFYNNDSFSWVL